MDYREKCKLLIAELKKFSSSIIELGNGVSSTRISLFEERYGLTLPDDFKHFVSEINGLNLMGSEILGFSDNPNSIENLYYREHYNAKIPQDRYVVPFHPDGGGNFYCLDTKNLSIDKSTCPIIFWVSNYTYDLQDTPEVSSTSFLEHIQEVIINWTLEDYNYDGSPIS